MPLNGISLSLGGGGGGRGGSEHEERRIKDEIEEGYRKLFFSL